MEGSAETTSNPFCFSQSRPELGEILLRELGTEWPSTEAWAPHLALGLAQSSVWLQAQLTLFKGTNKLIQSIVLIVPISELFKRTNVFPKATP